MKAAIIGAAVALAIVAAFVFGQNLEDEPTPGDRVGEAVDKAIQKFDEAVERAKEN